ncbi:BgTH12-03355 [Blumeria graminis f. sp. triticale]|uniref:EKC/KEOPS complex subunit BUD32 n=1 Tax=Blumeria graminis f. sp. triticale TaxID=1689686 RepID=A0A9W4DP45_BLUGR|nr:BgTH12-03355 [Blumeria graminis f. sp. triticale]
MWRQPSLLQENNGVSCRHQSLLVEKKILHGDISGHNIFLASPSGVSQGILIDLGHTVKVEETRGVDNLTLIGKMKFMALQSLLHAGKFKQIIKLTYHHNQ